MAEPKQRIRTIHNPDNEAILKAWYEDNGTKVTVKTKNTPGKNGSVLSVRQMTIG